MISCPSMRKRVWINSLLIGLSSSRTTFIGDAPFLLSHCIILSNRAMKWTTRPVLKQSSLPRNEGIGMPPRLQEVCFLSAHLPLQKKIPVPTHLSGSIDWLRGYCTWDLYPSPSHVLIYRDNY